MSRSLTDPEPEAVLAAMTPCVPYTAGELVDEFSDTDRWTVKRRLERLSDAGDVERKKHHDNRVTFWREE